MDWKTAAGKLWGSAEQLAEAFITFTADSDNDSIDVDTLTEKFQEYFGLPAELDVGTQMENAVGYALKVEASDALTVTTKEQFATVAKYWEHFFSLASLAGASADLEAELSADTFGTFLPYLETQGLVANEVTYADATGTTEFMIFQFVLGKLFAASAAPEEESPEAETEVALELEVEEELEAEDVALEPEMETAINTEAVAEEEVPLQVEPVAAGDEPAEVALNLELEGEVAVVAADTKEAADGETAEDANEPEDGPFDEAQEAFRQKVAATRIQKRIKEKQHQKRVDTFTETHAAKVLQRAERSRRQSIKVEAFKTNRAAKVIQRAHKAKHDKRLALEEATDAWLAMQDKLLAIAGLTGSGLRAEFLEKFSSDKTIGLTRSETNQGLASLLGEKLVGTPGLDVPQFVGFAYEVVRTAAQSLAATTLPGDLGIDVNSVGLKQLQNLFLFLVTYFGVLSAYKIDSQTVQSTEKKLDLATFQQGMQALQAATGGILGDSELMFRAVDQDNEGAVFLDAIAEYIHTRHGLTMLQVASSTTQQKKNTTPVASDTRKTTENMPPLEQKQQQQQPQAVPQRRTTEGQDCFDVLMFFKQGLKKLLATAQKDSSALQLMQAFEVLKPVTADMSVLNAAFDECNGPSAETVTFTKFVMVMISLAQDDAETFYGICADKLGLKPVQDASVVVGSKVNGKRTRLPAAAVDYRLSSEDLDSHVDKVLRWTPRTSEEFHKDQESFRVMYNEQNNYITHKSAGPPPPLALHHRSTPQLLQAQTPQHAWKPNSGSVGGQQKQFNVQPVRYPHSSGGGSNKPSFQRDKTHHDKFLELLEKNNMPAPASGQRSVHKSRSHGKLSKPRSSPGPSGKSRSRSKLAAPAKKKASSKGKRKAGPSQLVKGGRKTAFPARSGNLKKKSPSPKKKAPVKKLLSAEERLELELSGLDNELNSRLNKLQNNRARAASDVALKSKARAQEVAQQERRNKKRRGYY